MPIGNHINNEFLPTLAHAMRFRELADSTVSISDVSSFATATTFFCAASVEAAANGLLQLVGVSKKVFDLIDRFPVMEKIDYVVHARGKVFDRGLQPVQKVRDLIRDRHEIVHPKITTTQVEFDTLPGDELYAKRHVAKDAKAADGSMEREAAARNVRTTVDFLNYVFSDLLALTQTEAEHCLVGVGPTAERLPAYHIDSLRILLRYQQQHGEVRFIKLPFIPGEPVL